MVHPYLLNSVTSNCVKTSTSGTVTGLVILLAIVGGIVALAVANTRARGRLAAANSELAYLRPENARLQQWIAGLTGSPGAVTSAPGATPGGYASATSQPAQWYTDPSERHEFRYWDGSRWTEHVSDRGVSSTDPAG
jgi:hypothetical protein